MSIGYLSDFHKNASFIKGFYPPPPTVYVNSHYIANHYREQVLSSKHYYMGSMRFASALVSSPYRPPGWGEPAPAEEGEGPIEVEAGYSQESDGVIQDIASTLACLNGLEEIQVEMSSFNLQSLGEVMELLPCEELLPRDYPEELCNCEQDLYTAELIGYDCNLVNILYFYHPDYLGSVEYISDMRGEAYQFFLNTPWGENLENQFSKSYTSFSSRFRFNGKEWDEETGNFYYGARYYDPKISVWLSVDPLAHEYPGLSSYNFVANNPLVLVDPDGRKIINAHDNEVANAQSNLESKNTMWGRWWAQITLNGAKEKQARVDAALEELAMNDQEYYDKIDCITIEDNNGKEVEIDVHVHSTGRSEGPGPARQKGHTAYLEIGEEGVHPRALHNGKMIFLPFREGSNYKEMGFDVYLFGAESFHDITLANEFGDIEFFLDRNEEAVKGGGASRHFKEGGGGYDAYLESPSSKHSFERQERYKEKKMKRK